MINSTERAQPSVSQLVTGLLHDFKMLLMQELQLAKDEVREELGKARTAAVSLAVGLAMAAIGGLLLIVMLVHLLAVTGLPLWACYGLVGGLSAGLGVVLIVRAKSRAEDIHVVPVRTMQTMKENVSWIKEEVTSPRM
ncbi:phage holin family protein [Candidatus Nitrospira bockiana]